MSARHIYVFISHAWVHSQHYDKLVGWMFKENWRKGQVALDLKNFSVPKDDPIHDIDNDEQLKEAIFNKISRCHVIVIPIGMYASDSKWIQKEMDGAVDYSKPILAVNPWEQPQEPSVVSRAAKKTVGWSRDTVIKNIWDLYRQ